MIKEIISFLFSSWESSELRALSIIVTSISVSFVILTYIGERIINRINVKKDTRKKWLLEIIINPELENINKYFKKVRKICK